MQNEQDYQNLNPGVRVVEFGSGKVVCNFGTHYGNPCVFIEPVLGDAGAVGQAVPEGRESQITRDSVSTGGVILVFRNQAGLDVLLEDINSAIDSVWTVG